MERALLVTIKIKSDREEWHLEELALELEDLVSACGVEAVDNITCICEKPTPNYLIGRGKAEELAILAKELECDTVIFSHDLSGTQQRNLEELIGLKSIDRTQLILDIFCRRARSPEGKMQVELAQLQYLLPRLVGKGIILSRLGGGIGTRGPGEQKLEVDRRRIRKRIDKLRDDLKHTALHRQLLRKKRKENAIPTVALVGYTHAGKSTLLNALTSAGQLTSEKIFTTLDPLSKNLKLSNGESIVLSDTVGFLHNLPHHLVEAFKATLEEVMEADLLVHVIDSHNPQALEQSKAVYAVLKELGVEEKPMINALNKIDLINDQERVSRMQNDFSNCVAISAKAGINLAALQEKVEENFKGRMTELELIIPHSRMDLVDFFYREGKVKEIKYLQKGIRIQLNLPKIYLHKLLQNKDIEIIS